MNENAIFRLDRIKLNVAENIRKQARRRTLTHRLGIAAAAVVLGGAVTAATLQVAPAPRSAINNSADCYDVDNVSANHGMAVWGPSIDDVPLVPLTDRVRTALELCQDVLNRAQGSSAVDLPQLTACQLPDNRLAVFPNREKKTDADLCALVGLHVPNM